MTESGGARRGYTLIEVLVVIAIIAFLAAALAVFIPRITEKPRIASTHALMRAIDTAMTIYNTAFRRYPPDSQPGMSGAECVAWYLTTEFATPGEIAETAVSNPARAAKMVAASARFEAQSLPAGSLVDTDSDGIPSVVDAWRREIIYDEAPLGSDYGGRPVNEHSYNAWSPGPDGKDDRGEFDDIPRPGDG